MKNLSNYIKESIENDTTIWKLDQWFADRTDDQTTFRDIVQKWNKIPRPSLQELIQGTNIEKELPTFVMFVNDEISRPDNFDYMYAFQKILDIIVGFKSPANTYIY